MIKLIKPSREHFTQLVELKQDFINNNEPRIQGSGSIDKYDDLNGWLKSINDIEQGKNEKLVPKILCKVIGSLIILKLFFNKIVSNVSSSLKFI